jgi:hypothetical protein
MLITASAGAYYAFFACGLFVAAGLFGWLSGGTWRALASAGAMIAIIVTAGFANHLPTFLYHAEFGTHSGPVERLPGEAESYGLKIAQLILPIDDHKIRVLAEFKSIYNGEAHVQEYSERYSLGLIASLGFVGLMVTLLLPVWRRPPFLALAVLCGFAVAIGTVGGLGSVFNVSITPSVRCYNRIAIYIAFFSLFAVAAAGDRILPRLAKYFPQRMARFVPFIVWGGVLVIGLTDMTPFDFGLLDMQTGGLGSRRRAAAILANQKGWFEDEAFFSRIEATLNSDGQTPGPAVFQLPYMPWPEGPPLHDMVAYDHASGYLHTKTLRWSFGCIKGRETDEWYRSVAVMAPTAVPRMLDRIALAGFEGLVLDKRGYSPAQARLVEEQLLKSLAGANPIRHPDGHRVFFDLRRHRDDIRPGRDWEAESYRETHKACAIWLDGFSSFAEPGFEWLRRWGGPRATAIFVNPSAETKTVTSTFRITTEWGEPSTLTIEGGPIWSETLAIDKDSPILTRTFTIPPGRHTIRFRCEPPEFYIPTDSRRLMFLVEGFKFD